MDLFQKEDEMDIKIFVDCISKERDLPPKKKRMIDYIPFIIWI